MGIRKFALISEELWKQLIIERGVANVNVKVLAKGKGECEIIES